MTGNSEQKTNPASKRKLEKQREKGIVPSSQETANFVSQSLGILLLVGIGAGIFATIDEGFEAVFVGIGAPFSPALVQAFDASARIFVLSCLPVAAGVICSAIIVKLIFQKGLLFTMDPVIPKFERLDPIAGLKRIFGLRGWVEFGISLVSLILWSGVFLVMFVSRHEQIIAAVVCGLPCVIDIALGVLTLFIFLAILFFLTFSVVESAMQKFLFAQDQRMTKTEVKQERKEQLGSPEVRKSRKKMQNEMQDEAESTGVDNATMAMFAGNSAIAIRYHPSLAPTPILSAKSSSLAQSNKLRNKIRENGYLETEHVDFVTSMMKCPVGKPVPPELYDKLRDALYKMYM